MKERRNIKRWLLKHYPLAFPCRVYFVTPKTLKATHNADCFGDHEFDGKKHFIRLNKTLKNYEVNHTTIHEWTHAIIAELPSKLCKGPHDELFALLHTRILNDWLNQQ